MAPSLVEVGIPQIAAHMFALYFGMLSMITPPVAIAAFAAATVANSEPMKTGFSAVRFGWSAYLVPFLFVMAPELLFEGDPLLIGSTVVTAVAGIWLICAAFTGFLLRPIAGARRIICVAAGLALLLPSLAFVDAYWTDVTGIGLAIAVIGFEWVQLNRQQIG